MSELVPIAAGVIGFIAIVLPLVGALLIARARLIPSGDVRIVINGNAEEPVVVPIGTTLLESLTSNSIFVSSAGGGKGSCGVCKVRVTEGGGTALPTERAHISQAEANKGVRLSCQLKVKEDLAIELEESMLSSRKWECTVRSNRNVATFIKELVLELPSGESVPFRAGGYVQVECPPHELRYRDFQIDERFRDAWDQSNLWRFESKVGEPTQRAYSMANCPQEADILMLNVRIASPPPDADVPPGIVSSYIFGLRPGDKVTVSGPYGEFFAKETDAEMVFVGGGAGMAPMRSHIFDQLERLKSRREIRFWYGARSLREAFYVQDFDRLAVENPNFKWTLALSAPAEEDEWLGLRGFIHQVLYENYLSDHPAPEEIEYYLCGPPPMIDACEKMLAELGVDPENISYDKFG